MLIVGGVIYLDAQLDKLRSRLHVDSESDETVPAIRQVLLTTNLRVGRSNRSGRASLRRSATWPPSMLGRPPPPAIAAKRPQTRPGSSGKAAGRGATSPPF
jgi:hypothetical protein